MSQSPLNDTNEVQEQAYYRASVALTDLVRRGSSFSGHERHCVFLNTKATPFANISSISGLDYLDDGRALAAVDWDYDGDVDLWLGNRTAPRVRMMINRTNQRGHFLSLRLVGVKSNRDAIGARVVVHLQSEDASSPNAHATLLRTVRAGDAFLSQSSKWVHFGIDDKYQIQKLSVHWPGGDTQVFDAIKPDQHYMLVQGQPAKPWSPKQVKTPPPGEAMVAAHSDKARIVLSTRVPVPASFKFDRTSPTLLNLWASWCEPCVKELSQWSRQSNRFKSKGLNVIALSVDGIGENSATTYEDARQLLKTMGFAFQSGAADIELLSKLELLYALQYLDRHPFPVPTSFLIDSNGYIAVIYFGPVDIDQLLADVDLLEYEGKALRSRAFAVNGRWYTSIPDIGLVQIAHQFLQAGYLRDADYYRSLYNASIGDESYSNLCVSLGVQYHRNKDFEQSATLMTEALKINPKDYIAHRYMGAMLAKKKLWDQTTQHLIQVLAIKPDDLRGRILVLSLAWKFAGGEITTPSSPQMAIDLAKAAESAYEQKSAQVLDALAAAYARAGQFKLAVETAMKAFDLASELGLGELAAEIDKRRELYSNGQPYQTAK